jgi:putative lipoprotein
MVHRLALPLLACLVAACGGDSPPPQPLPPPPAPSQAPSAAVTAPPDVMLRGIVRAGASLTFRPCDGSLLMIALDSTSGGVRPIYRLMNATDEAGMYVLVRGRQSAGGDVATLREIAFASRPGPGASCEEPAPDYLVMLRGTNPAWQVTIRDQAIEFSQSDSIRIEFPAVAPEDTAGLTRYQTTQGAHSLRLFLTRAECSEGSSGNYMKMRADVVIDGRPLQGCAWPGRVP